MDLIELKTPVMAGIATDDRVIWHPGIVVGRTIEGEPRYDVRLENGQLIAGRAALPARMVRPMHPLDAIERTPEFRACMANARNTLEQITFDVLSARNA